MRRLLPFALAAFLLPVAALAAGQGAASVVRTDRSLVIATSSPGNAYALGGTVVVAAPVAGDLSALGGTITTVAPVAGDALILGGSASVRATIAGDLRAIAGSIDIQKPVTGDLAAASLSLSDSERVGGSVLVAGGTITLAGGAGGPVTIYGNTVTLGGSYASDVRVVAGDRLILLPGTTIKGSLSYQAPVPATIPDSATIAGGATYTQASYLPGADVSRTLALASIGIFLLARILASLVLAGLLAGLFPTLAEAVVGEAYGARVRHILLTVLLGFAAFVATPILFLLLALTFIGLGLAILLGICYILLILLALVYSGIFVGGVLARRFFSREEVLWRDGAIGTLVVSLIALIPVVGILAVVLLASFAAGALLHIFFRFAFARGSD